MFARVEQGDVGVDVAGKGRGGGRSSDVGQDMCSGQGTSVKRSVHGRKRRSILMHGRKRRSMLVHGRKRRGAC